MITFMAITEEILHANVAAEYSLLVQSLSDVNRNDQAMIQTSRKEKPVCYC
jgi:hypothetical protein